MRSPNRRRDGCTRVRILAFLALLAIVCSSAAVRARPGKRELVYAIKIEGTIDAGVANFVERSIAKAERDNAALIMKLNTPGGLVSATKDIVDRMLTARTTIVAWVTPEGAWAYSAGTYILLASNVAAMDLGTVLGAAQPQPAENKTVEAMIGWIREIATYRGRPADVAEEFVTKNRTMGPQEALESGIIDLTADGYDELLNYIDLSNAEVRTIEMGAFDRVLRILSDPQVVLILFIAGLLGIIAEVTTPGVGVPGIAGGICLLLALWGLGVLEVNYAAVALIILGTILLGIEIFTPGFGAFGVGGIVSLIFGFMMIDKEPWVRVAGDILKGVLLGLVIVFAFLLAIVRRSLRRKPIKVGREAMIGEVGTAVTAIDPKGMVRVRGELWTASSKERIRKGEEVVVVDVKGMELIVERRK